MSERLHNDVDPIETRDWLQAIESVIREEGVERAQYLIDQLLSEARKGGGRLLQALPPATTSTLLPLKMSRNTRAIWIWNVAFVLRFAGTPS